MSLIANAPLWFCLGVTAGGLLLSALSIIATRRLGRPDIGLKLSFLPMGISAIWLMIIVRDLVEH